MPTTPDLDALHGGFRERYLDFDALTAQLRAWAEALPELVRLQAIGESPEGRPLWFVTVGPEPDRRRPAAWVDGNMHASELCGSAGVLQVIEDALRVHLRLEDAPVDGAVADAVRDGLIYAVPRISPDGAEAVLREGHFVRSVPRAERIADRAPRWVPDDLDGDGLRLWMRKEDPTGEYVEAPELPGWLVPRRLGDAGPFYKLWPEGRIEGFDGETVPTPSFMDAGAPDLNRNFPFRWEPEPRQLGAGAFPMDAPESRAVVERACRHPEIFAWLNLHTFGGVFIRPLGDAVDTKMDGDDLAVWRELGEDAEAITGYPMVSGFEEFTYAPDTPIHGTLSEWAWHHRGAWACVCELWDFFAQVGFPREKRFVDQYVHRTREDLLAIARWDADENGGRMRRPWVPVDHPQLGRVEVGGFDPRFGCWNPPPERLGEVARNVSAWFLRLAARLPRVRVDAAVRDVGGGVRAVDVTVENHGYLGTRGPAVADGLPHAEPLWLEAFPEGGVALAAAAEARQPLGQLDGWGRGRFGGAETVHLMRSRGSTGRARARVHVTGEGALLVRVGSARVGVIETRVPIEG